MPAKGKHETETYDSRWKKDQARTPDLLQNRKCPCESTNPPQTLISEGSLRWQQQAEEGLKKREKTEQNTVEIIKLKTSKACSEDVTTADDTQDLRSVRSMMGD